MRGAMLMRHPGRALEPHDVWTAWTLAPAELALLATSLTLYAIGVRAVWRRAGRRAGVRRADVACFAAGWLVLVAALVSPLHAMGEVLFTAHMVQHELLVAVVAPLLVLGRPGVALAWAMPMRARPLVGIASRLWSRIAGVVPATLLHLVVLWGWHAPRAYQASLTSDAVHATQHVGFLATGVLFWWAVLGPRGGARRVGAGVFALFVTALGTGVLGALLTMAPRPWYPLYARTTIPWGLDALEDQQLAGLVMWIPASVAYIAAALVLVAHGLVERRPRAVHPRTDVHVAAMR
jgi:cytochrome c oxidase assembly factor CtaG